MTSTYHLEPSGLQDPDGAPILRLHFGAAGMPLLSNNPDHWRQVRDMLMGNRRVTPEPMFEAVGERFHCRIVGGLLQVVDVEHTNFIAMRGWTSVRLSATWAAGDQWTLHLEGGSLYGTKGELRPLFGWLVARLPEPDAWVDPAVWRPGLVDDTANGVAVEGSPDWSASAALPEIHPVNHNWTMFVHESAVTVVFHPDGNGGKVFTYDRPVVPAVVNRDHLPVPVVAALKPYTERFEVRVERRVKILDHHWDHLSGLTHHFELGDASQWGVYGTPGGGARFVSGSTIFTGTRDEMRDLFDRVNAHHPGRLILDNHSTTSEV